MHANVLNLGVELWAKKWPQSRIWEQKQKQRLHWVTKPLEDNMKKAIVTFQEASSMVRDIRKGLNVPADTDFEVLRGWKEQGNSLRGPY